MNVQKIISSSLSPDTQADDVWEALHMLLRFSSWQQGDAISRVEEWFTDYCSASVAVSFDSGRSALLGLLRAFDIGHGDEVLLQAFTCVAVPSSIRWAGAKPVFVDIDDRLNIDPRDVEKKITKRTKAVIVQHTFGIPAGMEAIMDLANTHGLIVLEDCAHSLGATYHGQRTGTLADAAFFSFGRDKNVSSVWGGIAMLNSKYQKSNIKNNLRTFQESLPYPSRAWIVQQLLHPIAFAVILPTYTMHIGKLILETMKRIRLLSVPVYPEEKLGNKPPGMPRRYPNALAVLLCRQLVKLDGYTQKRRRIARYYAQALHARSAVAFPRFDPQAAYLRFPIFVDDPLSVIVRAKRSGVLLGNWYHNVIDPVGVDLRVLGYTAGSCPRAEGYARRIVNLPTLICETEADRVLSLF